MKLSYFIFCFIALMNTQIYAQTKKETTQTTLDNWFENLFENPEAGDERIQPFIDQIKSYLKDQCKNNIGKNLEGIKFKNNRILFQNMKLTKCKLLKSPEMVKINNFLLVWIDDKKMEILMPKTKKNSIEPTYLADGEIFTYKKLSSENGIVVVRDPEVIKKLMK